MLPKDDIYYTIPTLIIHWILLYCYFGDHFDAKNCGLTYTLSDNNMEVRKQSIASEQLAYLTNMVESGVHEWVFKLKKVLSPPFTICIGVWKIAYSLQIETALYKETVSNKSYSWIVILGQASYGDDIDWHRYGSDTFTICSGDIVTMILDLEKYELRYKYNDQDCGVAFSNIERTGYKAVVSMFQENTVIELMSYRKLEY